MCIFNSQYCFECIYIKKEDIELLFLQHKAPPEHNLEKSKIYSTLHQHLTYAHICIIRPVPDNTRVAKTEEKILISF